MFEVRLLLIPILIYIVLIVMYIGASRDCKQYCKQATKALYQTDHLKQKHQIIDIKSFKDQNKDYILRIQRAWQPFDKELEKFFINIRKEIDWIEKDAKERLLEEELKTAINSDDKKWIELSRNIFNQKLDNVTCREVDQFLDIKDRQANNRNFLKLQKREEDFAYDILDDIKRAVYGIGKNLVDAKSRVRQVQKQKNTPKEPQPQRRAENRNERRDNRDKDRDYNRRDREPQPYKGNGVREEKKVNKEEKTQSKKQEEREPRREPRKREEDARDRRPERETERQPRRQGREGREGRQGRDGRREENGQHRRRNDRDVRQPRRDDRRRPEREAEKAQKNNKTYKKMKIIELTETSDQFSVEVKLISLIKNLRERDVWKVADGSGQIKMLIPEHESFKAGSNITVSNCYIKAHGSQLQIMTRLYSQISSPEIGNNVDIGSLVKNPRKPREHREHTNTGQTFKNFTKIADLQPGQQGLKLIGKVISVKSNKDSIECVLGDETGIVNAKFETGGEFLKLNNTVYLRDIEVDITGEVQGTIVLLPGNKFLIQNAREQIKKVKQETNISKRVYQACDE